MEMLKLEGIVDLIIPRGGEALIRAVTENSRIPVLKHYKGVCHIFVDRDADLIMAEEICFNAKVQRPGTCNAMETMLVDEAIAEGFLPKMLKRFEKAGVEVTRLSEDACNLSGYHRGQRRRLLQGISRSDAEREDRGRYG